MNGRWLTRVAFAAFAAVMVWSFSDVASADWLSDLTKPVEDALKSGNYGFALACIFLAGLATCLTPCVYPMIAITVSVFGAREATSKAHAAMLSTAFVLGMASLFTPLGLLAAATGDAFGSALSSPWVVFPMALLFIVLAFGMFGAFEMALPSSLQNKLATVGGAGYRGSFALGMVTALIAAPCTGPVLGFLLGWIATTGNMAFGALAFFVYALGLGALFWVVGTFAVGLPKSGTWMVWVKSIFGIIMIVVGLYFVKDFLPLELPHERTTAWLIASAVLAVVGIAVGAVHLDLKFTSTPTKVRKILGVVMASLGLLGVVIWFGALPPGAKIAWGEDYAAAKAQALSEGRPFIVDFGASWCQACKELEHNTFTDPRVVSAARDFVAAKVDLSPGPGLEAGQAILSSYEHAGLPLVVLHDREGNEVHRVTGYMEADEFLALVESVP